MNSEHIAIILEKLKEIQNDLNIIGENMSSLDALNDKSKNHFMVIDEKDYIKGSPEYENKHVIIIKDDKDVVESYGNFLYDLEDTKYTRIRAIRSLKRIKKAIINKKNNIPVEENLVELIKSVNDEHEKGNLKEKEKVNIYSDLYAKEKKLKK